MKNIIFVLHVIAKILFFTGVNMTFDIKALHDQDIDQFLDSINCRYDFENGRIKCKFCQKIITKDNLSAIFPESGMIHFVCDDTECFNKLVQYKKEL